MFVRDARCDTIARIAAVVTPRTQTRAVTPRSPSGCPSSIRPTAATGWAASKLPGPPLSATARASSAPAVGDVARDCATPDGTSACGSPGGMPAKAGAPTPAVPRRGLALIRGPGPPCGIAGDAVAAPGGSAAGRDAAGRRAPRRESFDDVRPGRDPDVTESGRAAPAEVRAGVPEPAGFDIVAEAPPLAGGDVGPGCSAEGDGAAVISIGKASSPTAQSGVSRTDVVPRRNTTSAAPAAGMVPLGAPASLSWASCPVWLTTRTTLLAGTVIDSTLGLEPQDRPRTPLPPKLT